MASVKTSNAPSDTEALPAPSFDSFLKVEKNTTPAWMPHFQVTSTACKNYKHLYSGCGCIHQDPQALTVHAKRCVYNRHGKMEEELYQAMHRDHACKESEDVHVIFNGSCQLCSPGNQILTRSRDSVRRAGYKFRAAFKVEDRSPPRQKPIAAQKPEPRSPEELERRIKAWEAEILRREHLMLRRAEDRKQRRKDAYNSYIASERLAEVTAGVPEADRFYLFNFTGGDGGDLLSSAEPSGQDTPCEYCGKPTRLLNGPPEKLPCGCLVHRDCAADQFLLTEHAISRQKARCTCGARFTLRQLHLDFEDTPDTIKKSEKPARSFSLDLPDTPTPATTPN